MVWESGCVVIVMLTPLSENGVKQCHHYWPDEGSDFRVIVFFLFLVVSNHADYFCCLCETNETRTVTQFHFLSWMDRGIPNSARVLLDFRLLNKYRKSK
uniref:Protein tyrosine phosphatase receptor type N2 n=1 Tax=Mastacembelus armatus TaxID=205130 RepID=A0A7N8XT51_9TELE